MRARYRVVTVGVVAGLALAGLATPASAHVEVSSDKTTAGATDVTLTFTGEAENPAAGIRSEQVYLPDGIPASGVSLVKAPAGWTFTRGAGNVTVGGTALKAGTDAVWKIKIAKLPDGQTRLSFKTLETYGNGDISRWIEIQQQGQAEPDNPAPLVTLKPGPSSSAADPTSSAADPTAVPLDSPSASYTPAPVAASTAGTTHWWVWVVVVVVIVIAGVGYGLTRRRRPGESRD